MWQGAWPSLTIVQLRDSLDAVVDLVDRPAAGQTDDVTRALARFLVVRSCGFLEQVSEEACRCYIRSKSYAAVPAYASSWLGRGANPTPENLLKLVRRFDGQWADALEQFLKNNDELFWREIALLVDRRNKDRSWTRRRNWRCACRHARRPLQGGG